MPRRHTCLVLVPIALGATLWAQTPTVPPASGPIATEKDVQIAHRAGEILATREVWTRVTTPAPSCPSTNGVLYFSSRLNSPLRTILSSGLMLAALTRTRTSRGPTVGPGTWEAPRPFWPYFSTTNAFIERGRRLQLLGERSSPPRA
jgi:hypothetical protein